MICSTDSISSWRLNLSFHIALAPGGTYITFFVFVYVVRTCACVQTRYCRHVMWWWRGRRLAMDKCLPVCVRVLVCMCIRSAVFGVCVRVYANESLCKTTNQDLVGGSCSYFILRLNCVWAHQMYACVCWFCLCKMIIALLHWYRACISMVFLFLSFPRRVIIRFMARE